MTAYPLKTNVIPVSVRRRSFAATSLLGDLLNADLETDLRRARVLADWLDTRFSIGGIRFGFESIIGLIPVLGDTIGALIGLYPLLIARRHKLGRALQLRMAANLFTEWAIGSIPLLGDLFDTAFKANIRNVRLLEKAAKVSSV